MRQLRAEEKTGGERNREWRTQVKADRLDIKRKRKRADSKAHSAVSLGRSQLGGREKGLSAGVSRK